MKIFYKLFSLILFLYLISRSISLAQTMIPLPTQTTTYTGYSRGFYFVAPEDMLIVGLRVVNDANSTANQALEVLRFTTNPPSSGNGTTLGYWTGVPTNTIVNANIAIYAGDVVGILGNKYQDTGYFAAINSYGSVYTSSIFGNSVTLYRFGFQDNIAGNACGGNYVITSTSGSIGRVQVFYTEPMINQFPYCEDFENSNANFVTGGTQPSWEYGTPNNTTINSANSGSKAWVTNLDGNYNNNELSYVRSPRIDMTNLTDPAVSFYTIRDLQSGYDGVQVQVSIDSGYTWNVLGSSSSNPPWYNSSSISALSSNGNGNGWTGTNSNWLRMQHSLSSYAGDTAFFFRFLCASNGSIANEGFGFDDLVVGESNDLELVSLIYPDSECGSANTTIKAFICNRSVNYKTGFSVILDTNGASVTQTYTDTLAVCSCDTMDLMTFNTAFGGSWNLSAEISSTGDVNAANDTASGTMTIFGTPTAHLSITGNGDYCQGDTALINVYFTGTGPWNLTGYNGSSYFYFGNISSNPYQMIVTEGGTYTLAGLADGSGCYADTSYLTGFEALTFHPSPNIDLGSDATVCGDYLLDAGSGFTSYAWNTGATTQSINPTQSGNYGCTVTNQFGCVASDSVNLTINPVPVVNLPDTVICEGGSFIFNAGGGYASYLWHDGSTGQQFQMIGTGTVSVTVTDFNGCEGSDQGSITAVVSNPVPNVQGGAGLAPITLNAGSGYLAYLWNTNETTQTIQVSVSGIYTCTVTDLNGCKGSDDGIAKIWPTGIEDILNEQGWVVYPNPASESITLKVLKNSINSVSVTLFDLNGRELLNEVLRGGMKECYIRIPSLLPRGTYLLKFQYDNELIETSVIIY